MSYEPSFSIVSFFRAINKASKDICHDRATRRKTFSGVRGGIHNGLLLFSRALSWFRGKTFEVQDEKVFQLEESVIIGPIFPKDATLVFAFPSPYFPILCLAAPLLSSTYLSVALIKALLYSNGFRS